MSDLLPSGRHASDADQDPTIVDELARMGEAEELRDRADHARRTMPHYAEVLAGARLAGASPVEFEPRP